MFFNSQYLNNVLYCIFPSVIPAPNHYYWVRWSVSAHLWVKWFLVWRSLRNTALMCTDVSTLSEGEMSYLCLLWGRINPCRWVSVHSFISMWTLKWKGDVCVSAGTWPLLREQDRPAGSDQGSGSRAGSEQHQGQLRGPWNHQDPLQCRSEQKHLSPVRIRRGVASRSHFCLSHQLWENEAIVDEFKKQLSIKRCGLRFRIFTELLSRLRLCIQCDGFHPSGSDRWRKSEA